MPPSTPSSATSTAPSTPSSWASAAQSALSSILLNIEAVSRLVGNISEAVGHQAEASAQITTELNALLELH
ncbi:hypothetical protein QU481_20805 [Crenobacter sp. SG2303]|uniref:Methyl-accepting transducer domain-containing protein n=1 Tax=Crenobacter oryzisoli TaxID=3056844 RepID=A0ABT7XU02_9NEIS|nr:hypothetical protein [Crenobacter sp. SG2303]MDN0077277.1 hypothetical protein [Crenobacter sp. SG2303]